MADVQFRVVTEENLDEFITELKRENVEVVFFAITVKGYENLSLNVNELRRYITQQQNLLVYYETQIKNNNNKDNTDNERK